MADYGRYDQARDTGRYDRTYDDQARERERAGQDAGRDRGMFGSSWGRDDQRGRHDQRSQYDGRGDHRRQGAREGREYGYDDRHEGLPIDETDRLIASNKVEGTAVYARDGGRIGSVYNFMVDKRSGKVEYAVTTYGGFLGMGTRYYPMPWDILSYDTRLGGYRVDMLERDLERAPSFGRHDEPEFDTAYGHRVRGWYGVGR